ncbi:MAG: RNA-binding S4 domain-containing protein [Candidatus Omnitrophica bacterium]|nr:RNA-binding S4 domain-containing protein [Candidatus Omnitrophota bacterium]
MKKEQESVRIDKWLWAVRICKTRLIAADLCKRQKVSTDGQYIKPSRDVKAGQVVTVKKDGIDWQYKILQCIDKRVGAKIAAACYEDLTPAEDVEKLKMIKSVWVPRRAKGEGRPTKKDRRAIERLKDFND